MSWTNTEKSKLGDARNILATYSEDVASDGKGATTEHMNVMGYSRVSVSAHTKDKYSKTFSLTLLGSIDGVNFYPLSSVSGGDKSDTILVSHHDLVVRFVKAQFSDSKKSVSTNITLYAST